MALPPVEIQFAAKLDEISSTLNALSGKFESFSRDTSSKFSSLGGAASDLIGRVKTLAAAFLSIEGMRRSIDATADLAIKHEKLAKQLNITGGEASVLDVALGDIYSSTEEFAQASQFLTRQLRSNEDRLNQLGLVTRDSNGELRGQQELMLDSVKILNNYKAGTDRNAASTEFFGRSASQMTNLLKLNNEVMETARKKAEDLGLVLTQQGKQSVDDYRAAMNDAGDVMTAVTKVVGEALMPIVTQFLNWVSGSGVHIVNAFRVAFGALAIVVHTVSAAFRTLVEMVTGAIQVVTVSILTVAESIDRAMRLDFRGAKETLSRGSEQIVDILKNTKTRIEGIEKETREAVGNILNPDTTPAGKQAEEGTQGFKPASESSTSKFETELAMKKAQFAAANAEQGKFQQFSLEMERNYWREVLNNAQISGEDKRTIQRKVYELDAAIAKQNFDKQLSQIQTEMTIHEKNLDKRLELTRATEKKIVAAYGAGSKEAEAARRSTIQAEQAIEEERQQLAEASVEKITSLKLSELANERAMISQSREQKLISGVEAVELEKEIDTREFEVRRDGLEKKLALEKDNKVKQAQIRAEIDKLDAEMVARMVQRAGERVRAEREAAAEILRIEQTLIERRKQLQLNSMNEEREQVRIEREMGNITAVEAIERERQISQQEYQIKRQALLERLALETEDRTKREELNNQIEALDQQHQAALGKNTNDRLIQMRNNYLEVLSAISGAFETSITGMIMGTTTWSKAMNNIFQSILGQFISMCVKMLVRWVANQLAMSEATATGAAVRTATETAAAGASTAAQAPSVIANIMNKAYETFAGIYAAIAAIPIVGPVLAPAAAAAGMAVVAAMVGNVISAERGAWELPQDSMLLAHKKEMVLPASLAERVRDVVDSGAGAAVAQGGDTINLSITAVDGRSVEKLFKKHGRELVSSLRSQSRGFREV